MLILVSQSSGRLATLRAAGVEPIVRVSDVDESAVLAVLARERRAGRRLACVFSTWPQEVARSWLPCEGDAVVSLARWQGGGWRVDG